MSTDATDSMFDMLLLPALLGGAVGGAATRTGKGAAMGAGIGLGLVVTLVLVNSVVAPALPVAQPRNALTDYLIATGQGGI